MLLPFLIRLTEHPDPALVKLRGRFELGDADGLDQILVWQALERAFARPDKVRGPSMFEDGAVQSVLVGQFDGVAVLVERLAYQSKTESSGRQGR